MSMQQEIERLQAIVLEFDHLLNEGVIMKKAEKKQLEILLRDLTGIVRSFD